MVVTTEAHLAVSAARRRSPKTCTVALTLVLGEMRRARCSW